MNGENEKSSSDTAIISWPFYLASGWLLYLGFAVWYIANLLSGPDIPTWQMMAVGSFLIVISMFMLVWPTVLSFRMKAAQDALTELRDHQARLGDAEYILKGYEHTFTVLENLQNSIEGERVHIVKNRLNLEEIIGGLRERFERVADVDGVSESHPPASGLSGDMQDLNTMNRLLGETQERLGQLETAIDATSRQISFLPEQGRMLGTKIDKVTTSLSESRYKSILKSLLAIFDLVDGLLKYRSQSIEGEQDAKHVKNYEVIRTQILQALGGNGLTEISDLDDFDPAIHRAIERVKCDDPRLSGKISEVVRSGFRTEHEVLRAADVTVWHYEPTGEAEKTSSGEDSNSEKPPQDRGTTP